MDRKEERTEITLLDMKRLAAKLGPPAEDLSEVIAPRIDYDGYKGVIRYHVKKTVADSAANGPLTREEQANTGAARASSEVFTIWECSRKEIEEAEDLSEMISEKRDAAISCRMLTTKFNPSSPQGGDIQGVD
jgi:hypothetical protein